ncbi:hypothetical protein KR044_002271 [Drosophila immigrans]|nr:hypothetical protein KR044_002271 [Drosophila immigrans]
MKLLLSIELPCRQMKLPLPLPLILFLLFALALTPAKAIAERPKSVVHSSYCLRFEEEINVVRPICEYSSVIPYMARRCHFSCSDNHRLNIEKCRNQLQGSVIYPSCDDIFCRAGSD